MGKNFINDPGFEVPENKILVIPNKLKGNGRYDEIIEPLKGNPKRNWFNKHFYYCLPLMIGNQQGFVVKSLRDFDVYWDGRENQSEDIHITFLNDDNKDDQYFKGGFSQGILTIQNSFSLKTPPGIGLMTIQPPNMYIPGTVAMTGVIETDQIRRDFTFNLKITMPNMVIKVRKGDPVGAFIPVQRRFIDNFEVDLVSNYFNNDVIDNEHLEEQKLNKEREMVDKNKPNKSGRRYFNGIHSDGTKYPDHQKKLT
jgi:hypothetical protein